MNIFSQDIKYNNNYEFTVSNKIDLNTDTVKLKFDYWLNKSDLNDLFVVENKSKFIKIKYKILYKFDHTDMLFFNTITIDYNKKEYTIKLYDICNINDESKKISVYLNNPIYKNKFDNTKKSIMEESSIIIKSLNTIFE